MAGRDEGGPEPTTAYLPPERSGVIQLAAEISRVAHDPVVNALLLGSATALAILDEQRQVVALNGAYLSFLGAPDPGAVLGLRPGEAAGCRHAKRAACGCGTARACASCGAAIAVLAASRGEVLERDCALSIDRPVGADDRVLRVRAAPLAVGGRRLVAFALVDVTEERRREALQRVFLHDLANLAAGLQGAAEEVASARADGGGAARDDLRALSARLVQEVRLQRALVDGGDLPRPDRVPVRAAELVRELAALATHHPAAAGKRIELAPPDDVELVTDPLLLEHVLGNMAVNALEATPPGGVVRVRVEQQDGHVAFRVWNAGAIPAVVRPRIFQRHFTTKGGAGRGQGTYAMRLLGEACLGGRVGFTSGPGEGTTFEVALPRRDPGPVSLPPGTGRTPAPPAAWRGRGRAR